METSCNKNSVCFRIRFSFPLFLPPSSSVLLSFLRLASVFIPNLFGCVRAAVTAPDALFVDMNTSPYPALLVVFAIYLSLAEL